MQALQKKHAVIDGVRLNYLEREPVGVLVPEAAPIFLLHSLLATAETWAAVIAGLPTNRRIIALDLLSAQTLPTPHARKPRLDVHFANLTRLIHGLIQHLGLYKPVLLGHSHGGVLALSLTATHPALPSALVLLCPAHPFGGYRSHVVNFYLRQPGRALALSIPLAPSWMILRAFNEACGPARPLRMKHLKPYLRILRHRNSLRRVLQMLHTWDDDMTALQSSLAEATIATPTLLFWGDADVIVPLSSAPGLEAHLDHCERITLPNMGHLLPDEAPAVCAARITDWLTRTIG